MILPFRYQFILAPSIVVVLLACLVAYTLFELSKIYDENEATKNWEILTDRIQIAIAGAHRLNNTIDELASIQDLQQDDNFFDYLEQTSIVADSLSNPVLLAQLSPELRQQVIRNQQLLQEPERADPRAIRGHLRELLPALEYQYTIFAAQRRSAFIANHRQLVAISSRMTVVLLAGLMSCIVMASGLAIWGLTVTRQRLNRLTQQAHSVCVGDRLGSPAPKMARDELDNLEMFITDMTTRLTNVVSMEHVLSGIEAERRRIAMDMHDGALADLTALNRQLADVDIGSSGVSQSGGLCAHVDDIITNLRRTIDDLHPQVLETLGLESAVQSFLMRHKVVAGYPGCHFEFSPVLESMLPMGHKLNLFRITSEAINNIIKHAHCDRFEVCFRVVTNKLIVTVEDNGVGVRGDMKTTGHGYVNIYQRAHLIGASVQWRASRFTSGTCFELTLSLAQLKTDNLSEHGL